MDRIDVLSIEHDQLCFCRTSWFSHNNQKLQKSEKTKYFKYLVEELELNSRGQFFVQLGEWVGTGWFKMDLWVLNRKWTGNEGSVMTCVSLPWSAFCLGIRSWLWASFPVMILNETGKLKVIFSVTLFRIMR